MQTNAWEIPGMVRNPSSRRGARFEMAPVTDTPPVREGADGQEDEESPAGHRACLCETQRLTTMLMIFIIFFELRTAQNEPQSRQWGTEKNLPNRALLRNGWPVRALAKITGPNLKESIGFAELKIAPKRTINQNNGCITQKKLSYKNRGL